MNSEPKAHPLKRCAPADHQAHMNLQVQRQAIDQTLAIAIDQAMTKHAVILASLSSLSGKLWAEMIVKYELDPTKSHGLRMIDGKPYICEIKKGEPPE